MCRLNSVRVRLACRVHLVVRLLSHDLGEHFETKPRVIGLNLFGVTFDLLVFAIIVERVDRGALVLGFLFKAQGVIQGFDHCCVHKPGLVWLHEALPG